MRKLHQKQLVVAACLVVALQGLGIAPAYGDDTPVVPDSPTSEEAPASPSDPGPPDGSGNDAPDVTQSDAQSAQSAHAEPADISTEQSGQSSQSGGQADSTQSAEQSGALRNAPAVQQIRDVTPPAPILGANGVTVPTVQALRWIVGGKEYQAGSFVPFQTRAQRKRIVVSAVSSDPQKYRVTGVSSWVLSAEPMIDSGASPRNEFTWKMRQDIGHGWTGRAFAAGDMDHNGAQDVWRITPQGQLILYPTFADGRFSRPTPFGYGWDAFHLLAGGVDFNGDGNPDIVGADRAGRLYLYRGNGKGSLQGGRVAYGYGWDTFQKISLAPAGNGFAPRLVATHRSGQMFIYEGDGRGGFKGGRSPLGYGWETIREYHAAEDWNHDGHPDLIAVVNNGHLRFYPGLPNGLWAGSVKVGQGWGSQRQITLIHGANLNSLWSIDHSHRLWRYVNTQVGHYPATAGFSHQHGFVESGFRLKESFPYPLDGAGIAGNAWPLNPDGSPRVALPGLNGGRPMFHPVAFSRFALDSAQNAMKEKDSRQAAEYRRRAVATGNALLANATRYNDEMWFAYSFPYRAMHDPENELPVPWFSGMSQGLALAAFIRLEQLTGDIKWRIAADQTLASYYARPGDPYWFAAPDADGYLWLEEYPGTLLQTKVVNGHLFSIEGLQYYWLHTHAAAINPLVDGAATAAAVGFPEYRFPGKASGYCASLFCWRKQYNPYSYHRIVGNQLEDLGVSLGDQRFVNFANILRADA